MRTKLLSLAALCLAVPSITWAATPKGDVGAQVSSPIPGELARSAGISPEQEREIARVTTEANLELESLRTRHHQEQRRLEELLQAEPVDEAAVLKQVERLGAAETDIRKNRISLMFHIRHILGPQKWARLQSELEAGSQRVRQPLAGAAPEKHPSDDGEVPRVGEPVKTEQVSGTLRSNPH